MLSSYIGKGGWGWRWKEEEKGEGRGRIGYQHEQHCGGSYALDSQTIHPTSVLCICAFCRWRLTEHHKMCYINFSIPDISVQPHLQSGPRHNGFRSHLVPALCRKWPGAGGTETVRLLPTQTTAHRPDLGQRM